MHDETDQQRSEVWREAETTIVAGADLMDLSEAGALMKRAEYENER